MSDVLFLVYSLALLALVGVPTAVLLPRRLAARLSLAPVLGYCILAILSPNLFRAGLAMLQQLWVYGALAALGLICLGVGAWRRGGLRDWPQPESVGLALAWALAAALLSLPKWLAGEQYYAYLGNIWDYFNYTTAGALFAKASPAALSPAALADPAAYLRNPMLLWANVLESRPAVMMVFSDLAEFFLAHKIPLFALANDFMSLTLSLHLCSLYFFLRNATPAGPAARLVIPLVFVCGFWGGYLIDVDAWSQLAAVMLMPALFALGLAGTAAAGSTGERASGGEPLRLGLAMALLVAGAGYLYPELVPVYGLIYSVSLLASLAAGGWQMRRLAPQFIAAAVGLLAVLPSFSATFGFMAGEVHSVASDPNLSVGWFDYFHAFLLGGDDLSAFTRASGWSWTAFVKYLDAGAALAGLYRLLPAAGATPWLTAGSAIAGASLTVALAWCAVRALTRRTLWLPAALAAGAAIVVALAVERNLYGAGKAFFWLSPFILVFLLLPLADPRVLWRQKLPACIYVALQAVTMLIRLGSAATQHGMPGPPPYPGDHDPARKAAVEINLARLFDRLDACRMVRVDVDDPFLRHYVMVNLYARDVAYFSTRPINSYYGAGSNFGLQRPSVAPDCTLRAGAAASDGGRRQAFAVEPAAK